MRGEGASQRAAQRGLQGLQVTDRPTRSWGWAEVASASFNVTQRVGDVLDADFVALRQSPAPQRLKRGAERGTFADFEGDDLGLEDIRHDLAPQLGIGAAPGGSHLFCMDAQFGEAQQSVIHSQGDPFHGGAREMGGGEGLRSHAEGDGGAVGDVGGSFAFQVREQEQAIGTRGATTAVFSNAA